MISILMAGFLSALGREDDGEGPAGTRAFVDQTTRQGWLRRRLAGKCEKVIHLTAVLAWTWPWINKSPSLENPAGILSSFLSGEKKKNSYPCEECIAFNTQLPKPNCRQNPSDKNPLTALIQFLKEISGWKVTEKPAYFTLQPGVSKLSLLRGSPTSCPFPPGRLINESTNSYRTRLPWSLQVTSDVPLQFNSRRKKNRFFWLFLKFPFIKPGLTWKDCGSLLPLFLFPWTLLIHKEKENAMELRD